MIQRPDAERVDTVAGEAAGIFYPLVKRGTCVDRGARVGDVTDYLGRTVLEAKAPEAGVVLFIRAVPSITRGDHRQYRGAPALNAGAARDV